MVKRILIVDDEETLTYALYQSFIHSKDSVEVVTALTGEEAVEKFKEKPCDLVITDIFLPGIKGWDVIRQIREMAPETKFIVITAYGSSETEEQAKKEGALLYMDKPFDLKNFKQKVIEMME